MLNLGDGDDFVGGRELAQFPGPLDVRLGGGSDATASTDRGTPTVRSRSQPATPPVVRHFETVQ